MGLWSGAYYSHSLYSNMDTILISLLSSVIETDKIYTYIHLSIMFTLTERTKAYGYLGWQATRDHIVAKMLSVYYLLLWSNSSNSYQFCQDRLDKQGFWKHDTVTVKNKTQEFSEKQGSGDQHGFKVKVLKLNPSQLYYTFSHEGKNVRGVKL